MPLKSDCPIDPATINPKCGTLPSIAINAGVNGVCTHSVRMRFRHRSHWFNSNSYWSPTYLWTTTDGLPKRSKHESRPTALPPGTYSVKITDANKCVTNKSRTITATTPPALVAKTNVTCVMPPMMELSP
jgi:hypothetical protein